MKRRYSNFIDQKITPYDEPQPVDPSTSGGSQTKPTPQPTNTSTPPNESEPYSDPYNIGEEGTNWTAYPDGTITYIDKNGELNAIMVKDPSTINSTSTGSQKSSTPSEQKTPWKMIGLAAALVIAAFIIYETL